MTNQLQLSPGTVHLAVIAAGQAWTNDPRGRARTHISNTIRSRAPEPTVATAAATTRPSTPPADPPPGTTDPAETWKALADRIDPRLAHSPGWVGLAATIDQAAREGYDVKTQLPRLAATALLPDDASALELQYRFLSEIEIETPQTASTVPPPQRAARPERPPAPPQVGRDRPASPRR